MEKEDKKLNLIEKLAGIRAICDAVKKSKKGYNYTYTDLEEILAKVTAGMKKYRVSLIPRIVPQSGRITPYVATNTKVDKTGKPYDQTATEMIFTADMTYTWVNEDDTNDTIEVPWFVAGSQADPSQAIGSGLSYTERQFITHYFQMASTENDVDGYRSKQKAAEDAENIAIADGIIGRFDEMVKKYLADNPTKDEEVRDFISKYAGKKANYFSIKVPELASKLLNDFEKKFVKGE